MYRQPDPFQRLRGQVIRAGVPFTISIIAITVICFLVDSLAHGLAADLLWCRLAGSHILPLWGPITYVLDTGNYIGVVFGCLWLWWMGASLERAWSTQRFALFSLGISLLTALSVYIGTTLLRAEYTLAGIWIPLSALTVAWAALNARQTVLLYFVLPVPAWALAAFVIGLVYFVYFQGQPILGLFGLVPCAAAYFYVRNGASIGRAFTSRGPDLRIVGHKSSPLDGSRASGGPLGWYRAWQEQRRLRKLWRDSGFSDRDR